jgi:hypothetical protein
VLASAPILVHVYAFFKGFIALISKGGTCGVTKLFRNNNQFATVFLQLFIGK